MTDGSLEWIIRKADGSEILLRAPLYPLNSGEYSYRLDVPHSALAYEMDDTQGIPLPPIAATNAHVSATVDGLAAVFAGPSGASFAAGQATRAATYRLDLEIALVPVDSDGDGIPDWWEDKYGLDKQGIADASGDADGDGVSNLQEYLRGLNPLLDSRMPELVTDTLLAYAGCTTGVRLETDDIDSAPTDLIYTLLSAPANGKLMLRNQISNPDAPDLQLTAGAEFSQQDVADGKVVFDHDSGSISNDLFVLSVRDEEGSHTASTGTVAVAFYEPEGATPSTLKELRRYRAYIAGLLQGAVIWDGTDDYDPVAISAPSSGLTDQEYSTAYVPAFGNELGQMMIGGRDDDALSGGMAADTLAGGKGTDVLTGGGGADLFVFDEGDLGSDMITDFDPDEGDVIDLDGVLSGLYGLVENYVQFGSDGTNTLLGLNLDGNGSAFTNLVITLADLQVNEEAVYDLVLQGDVLAGNLQLRPRITVAATDAEASENGNNSGKFVLNRTGSLGGQLDVAISLGGSAVNGVDYSLLGSLVTFAPGIREVTQTVSPFADSLTEVPETVELVLQSGSGYVLHSSSIASLIIKDLQPVVGVEVSRALGTKEPSIPAKIYITRDGPISSDLQVDLDIGGSARNGFDYFVDNSVYFGVGQTKVEISLVPYSSAVLSGGSETVLISVREDEDYALADVSEARLILAERLDYFDIWQAREFPGSTESPAQFAAGDAGGLGIDNLQRFAYGMDPLAPERSRTPQIVFRDGRCCVDVFRNPGVMDVEFVVEVSTDLVNWDSSTAAVVKVVAPEHEDASDIETYQAVAPVLVTPRMYLRVRLIYEP